jgi:large subunit ribosomal protein L10
MPNAEKVDKVAALKGRIEGASALLLAEYRGLTVHDATELRRSLSESARFSVVKNTLMQRAADQAGIAELEGLLSGPTAVAFVDGDVVAAAKKVVDAAKKFPSLVLKGAYLDGRVLDAAEAQALATLESREVMLSKIAGMLKAEMTRAASMFQTLQSRFVGLLEAYRDKLPAEAEAEEASEPEPSSEPELSSEPEGSVEEPSGDDSTEAEPSETTEEG